MRDIRPEVITAAIRETLEKTSEIPRAFVQTKFLWNPPVGAPKWKSFEKYLDPKDVEIVCIGEDGPVSEADAVYRQPGTEDGSQMSEALTRRTEVREKKIELQDERSLGSHERLYQTAQEFLGGGRKKEAVDVLEQLVASYPDHAFAHNDLGFLYFNEGDKEKTLQHYKMAAALEPQNYVFQKSLADFYYVVLGQVEDALEYYAKALSRNPEDLETLLMLGHISISLRKFDEASSFYDEVLKIEPLNSDAKEKLDALRRIELRDLREQRALG